MGPNFNSKTVEMVLIYFLTHRSSTCPKAEYSYREFLFINNYLLQSFIFLIQNKKSGGMVFLEKFFVIQKRISLSLSKCNKCFIININKPYKLCKLWVLLHLVNTFLMSLISLWKYFLKCHLRSSIWPCICMETSSNTFWKSRIVSDNMGSFYFNLY